MPSLRCWAEGLKGCIIRFLTTRNRQKPAQNEKRAHGGQKRPHRAKVGRTERRNLRTNRKSSARSDGCPARSARQAMGAKNARTELSDGRTAVAIGCTEANHPMFLRVIAVVSDRKGVAGRIYPKHRSAKLGLWSKPLTSPPPSVTGKFLPAPRRCRFAAAVRRGCPRRSAFPRG